MNYYDILSFKNIGDYSFTNPEDYSTFNFYDESKKPTEIQINQYSVEYNKSLCKAEAKRRIAEYDWIVDTETTPDLLNRQDFVAYRSALRQLILNPIENPIWPEIPQEEWS